MSLRQPTHGPLPAQKGELLLDPYDNTELPAPGSLSIWKRWH